MEAPKEFPLMSNLKRNFFVLAALVALGGIGSLFNSNQSTAKAAGGGPTVTIDSSQLPLAVSLKGSGSITGTVDANITNATLSVRDVDNPARHPYIGTCQVIGANSAPLQCQVQRPAGARVVLEYINVNAIQSVGGRPPQNLRINTGIGDYYLPYQGIGCDSLYCTYVAQAPVKIILDPSVAALWDTNFQTTPGTDTTVTISAVGYYIAP
jgi:hypothetical protein